MADGDDSNIDTFLGHILVGGKWGCESLAGGCMGECVGPKSMLGYLVWGVLGQWSIRRLYIRQKSKKIYR